MPGCVLFMQDLKMSKLTGKLSKSGCSDSLSVSLRICSSNRLSRGNLVTGRDKNVIRSRFRIRGSEDTDWMKALYISFRLSSLRW